MPDPWVLVGITAVVATWMLTVVVFVVAEVLRDRAHQETLLRFYAIDRNPADAARIVHVPVATKAPRQPPSLSDEERACREMVARGLDPEKMEDRAEFLQRAAMRS